jgi:hypothetical protein
VRAHLSRVQIAPNPPNWLGHPCLAVFYTAHWNPTEVSLARGFL